MLPNRRPLTRKKCKSTYLSILGSRRRSMEYRRPRVCLVSAARSRGLRGYAILRVQPYVSSETYHVQCILDLAIAMHRARSSQRVVAMRI